MCKDFGDELVDGITTGNRPEFFPMTLGTKAMAVALTLLKSLPQSKKGLAASI